MNRDLKFIIVLYGLLSGFHFLQANNFVVSGGDSSSPFYQFTDSNSQTTDFSAFKLVPGQTYKFIANGISTSHPFMIGESNGDTSSSLVSGGPLTGSIGEITLTIPAGYAGDLFYFCTAHVGMSQAFQISNQNDFILTDGFSYTLFDNQYYKLTNPDRELFISDQVGSNSILSEVFPSRQVASDEYLLFHSIYNSPRQYNYFDPHDLDFNGSIQVVPYIEQGPVINDQLGTEDYFGYMLAINDWNETIVSAPSKNENAGVIYIFELDSNNQLMQKSSIQPESGDEGWWGASLQVSGDMLFIGAPDSDSYSGKVIMYKRINGNYIRQSEVTDPLSGVIEYFGSAISFESNQNNLVISPNVAGDRTGRVEIFDLNASQNLNHTQTLWSDHNVTGNYFGIDHALNDEFLIVGAPQEGNRYGRAYIFDKESDGSWSNSPSAITPALGGQDEFGVTVEIMDDFAFVGAKLADGNVTDAGAVYIFKKELGGWTEKTKLIPPTGESQTFANDLQVLDDLLIVTSIGVGSGGRAYIYKMYDENASDWRLISALDNNGSTTASTRQFLPIASNKGMIAIGSPEDSQNVLEGGSFKLFMNRGWQEQSLLELDPLFANQPPSHLGNILEDSTSGISFLFEIEHPFESNFTYSISSTDTPPENYSISSDGNFTFIPEGNFSGNKSFTVQVNSLNGALTHSFNVDVLPQPDAPIFESNQSLDLDAIWIGENVQQVIQVFDADGDSLSITSNSLPEGLSVSGVQISGTITDDTLLNNQSFRDFSIDLTLSDGNTSHNLTKTFNLRVYARNSPPFFVDENDNEITFKSIVLDEDFNESSWSQSLGFLGFRDDLTADNNLTLSLSSSPSHGSVTMGAVSSDFPILYLSESDYYGNDSFTVTLHDASTPPKSCDLDINITINPVNDYPSLSSPTEFNANEGIPFTYSIEWTDIDNDNGHLVSVQNLPAWIHFDQANNILSGTAQWEDYKEDPYEISISIEDPEGLTTNAMVGVRVIPENYPPKFNLDDLSLTINEDSTLELPISSRDEDLEDDFVDWDIITHPSNGISSLTVDSGDEYLGNLTYVPDGNFSGSDYIKIKIYDPLNLHLFDTLDINITILSEEDPPVINPKATYTDAVVGYNWSFEFFGEDGDVGQDISFIEPSLPSWLSYSNNLDVNASRAKIFGVPSVSDVGQTTITLQTIDNTGRTGEQTFDIRVLEENSVPLIQEGDTLNVELTEDGFWQKQNPLTSLDENKQMQEWTIFENSKYGTTQIEVAEDVLKSIRYEPDHNFTGTDSVVIQVSDGIDSDQFTFVFEVINVDDAPIFHPGQNGIVLRVEDGEELADQNGSKITFYDGDMDLATWTWNPEILPQWVNVDTSKFLEGEISLSGVPQVSDENVSAISLSIFDDKNLSSELSFVIEAYVNNYPPVLTFDDKNLTIEEDQPKVKLGLLSVSDLDQATGHDWFISKYPQNGSVMLDLDGERRILYYLPDGNFSGLEEFAFTVRDNGTELGAPKYHTEEVTVQVNPVSDFPVFISSPQFEAFAGEEFVYDIQTKDGDLPEDELNIELISSPPWLTFVDNGDGSGQLKGIGSYMDEGFSRISLKVQDLEGNYDVQSFLLDLKVLDYPPVFKSRTTSTILDKVTLYVNEDQMLDGWTHPKGFYAVNPDPENDDYKKIKWSLGNAPSSGGEVRVDGYGDRPPFFNYTPPLNFSGKDYFSLLMDEGDLFTELPFEIEVSPVADPPFFTTDIQPVYLAKQGELFNLEINVEDVDSSEIQFRLIAPSWEQDPWLELESYDASGFVALRGIPRINPNGNIFPYTIIAFDESGLIVSKGFSLQVEGVNSPPRIIPEEIEILFGQDGYPLSDYSSLRAYDAEGDSLTWTLQVEHPPLSGEVFVEGNGSLPEILTYFPRVLEDNVDIFWLNVSDGVSSDSVLVRPLVLWEEGISIVGEIEDFTLKERQGFSSEMSFYPDNNLDEIELTLLEGPSWVEINEITRNVFTISGIAPTGSLGSYNVTLLGEGERTDAFRSEFNIQVVSGTPPTLSLNGDDIVRISNFEPFENEGATAFDSDGTDLTQEILVSILDDSNSFGYQIIEYSVRDKNENENSKKLLLREYSECPLVVNHNRLKVSGANKFVSWTSRGEIEITANQFKIIEENGSLVERAFIEDPVRNLFLRDLNLLRADEFHGDNLIISQVLTGNDETFVAGQFSKNLHLGFSSIFSEHEHNAFVASFNNLGELNWVKSFGSSAPIESLNLVEKEKGSLILAGSFSQDLNYKGSNQFVITSQQSGLFICEFLENGELLKHESIEVPGYADFVGCKSSGEEIYLIFNDLSNESDFESKVLVLNSNFEIKNELKFLASNYLKIADLELTNGFCVIGGTFQGNLTINGNPMLLSLGKSAFLLNYNQNLDLVWAKSFPSSEDSQLQDFEIDYWGDLILGISYTDEFDTGIGNISSKGEEDLVILNCKLSNANTLWFKEIGGLGKEIFHSIKTGDLGTPLISFETTHGLFLDGVEFSETETNEIHTALLTSRAGIPQIELEEIVINDVGSFSMDLQAIHPEFLFFQKVSGPDWINIVSKNGNLGQASILGDTSSLTQKDLNEESKFRVRAFTMDGTFDEKDLSIVFPEDSGFNLSLGALPDRDLEYDFIFDKQSEVSEVLINPRGGWLVVGQFPNLVVNRPSDTNTYAQIAHLSPDMHLSNICTLYSSGKIHISDVVETDEDSFFIYGTFSGIFKCQNIEISSNGGSDIFLIEVSSSGIVTDYARFGSDYDDISRELLFIKDFGLVASGSFDTETNFRDTKLVSNGQVDGFIACIDRNKFSEIIWAENYGYEEFDQITCLAQDANGSILFGLTSNTSDVDDDFDPSFKPKSRFDLSLLQIRNGQIEKNHTFYGSGRINNAKITGGNSTDISILAFEFEGSLEWKGGRVSSAGGFDIFTTSVGRDFATPQASKLFGGSWNDRLTDLDVMGNHYYLSLYFYQNTILNGDFLSSTGSSDAVIVKVDSAKHEITDYTVISTETADEITCVLPIIEEFILCTGLTAKSDSSKTETKTFFGSIGSQETNPKVLSTPPSALSTSYPFSFTLETGPWGMAVNDFELIQFEEEGSYNWIRAEVDSRGSISFSGVAPNLEQSIPFDFSLFSSTISDSLAVQFELNFLREGFNKPVIDADNQIEIFSGDSYISQIRFYDLDGDELSIAIKGPDWIKISNIGDGKADLVIESGDNIGLFEFLTIVTDNTGSSVEHKTTVSIEIGDEDDQPDENEEQSADNLSWISNRVSFENGWSYHLDFGWLYVIESQDGSAWLWKENLGWLWSKYDLWQTDGSGYFFNDLSSNWLFWNSENRKIFEFETNQWQNF